MFTILSKRMLFGFLLFVLFPITLNAQLRKTIYPAPINKWLRACLNLEVHPNFFQSKIWGNWQAMMARGIKLNRDSAIRIQEYYQQQKFTATGLFVFYHNKHYIVTARHFLVDENAIMKDEVHFRIFLINNGSPKVFDRDTNYEKRITKTIARNLRLVKTKKLLT